MLVNNNRRYYKWMACTQVVSVCVLLLNLSAFAYDAWQPDNESVGVQGLDNILEELETLLATANASKAAHPVFPSDLEDVLERLKKQRDIIADSCVSTYPDYAGDYASPGFSYSEPKVNIGPNVEYLGLDDDKIGPWSISSPDGSRDGHFQANVYFPKEVEVKNLRLHKSNYQGEKLESYWFSDLDEAWILGVFRNGKMLNPNREDSLGSFSDWVLFDIYAAVEGVCFDEGKYLLLEMTTGGGVLTRLLRIGGDIQ